MEDLSREPSIQAWQQKDNGRQEESQGLLEVEDGGGHKGNPRRAHATKPKIIPKVTARIVKRSASVEVRGNMRGEYQKGVGEGRRM